MDASHTTRAKKQFERALLLGNGGSSLSTLAVRIDADIKQRKERSKRVMMAMFFSVFKASTTAAAQSGSGSAGYGGGGGAYSYGAVQPLAAWSQNSMANMQWTN